MVGEALERIEGVGAALGRGLTVASAIAQGDLSRSLGRHTTLALEVAMRADQEPRQVEARRGACEANRVEHRGRLVE